MGKERNHTNTSKRRKKWEEQPVTHSTRTPSERKQEEVRSFSIDTLTQQGPNGHNNIFTQLQETMLLYINDEAATGPSTA